MKILFTGASSFSGMWMVKELSLAGFSVTATFQKKKEAYEGMAKDRVQMALKDAKGVFECSFGDELFLKTLQKEGPFTLFCHHGAFVTDYKSPNFDFLKALSKNTYRLQESLKLLKETGCQGILLTGTVFEQREGLGSSIELPVSPYGLSKGLTSDVFSYFSSLFQLPLGKFIIPNPFGPFEEPKFTTYLAQKWLQKLPAEVAYPDYVRDNIPVSLLAKAYRFFVEQMIKKKAPLYFCPSGYVESQGAFVSRFSEELKKRLNLPCTFYLKEQKTFLEPRVRINKDTLDWNFLQFDASHFWDELAQFYHHQSLSLGQS